MLRTVHRGVRHVGRRRMCNAAGNELEQAFLEWKEASTTIPSLGNEGKLKLYALYKQATEGPAESVGAERPGMFDFVARAKYDAWAALGPMPREDAMSAYIDTVKSFGATPPGGEPAQAPEAAGTGDDATDGDQRQSTRLTLENGVATLRLNRPARMNAFDFHMYTEVVDTLHAMGQDPACRVLVLTGTGDYYSSGNDLANFANIPPEGPGKLADDSAVMLESFVDAFISFPKPLIAGINGPSVGIATTVLGLCDIVIASHRATFHTPFTALGMSPEGCSSVTFPECFGHAKAAEVLLEGRKFTAAEALQMGFASSVVEHGSFDGELARRAAELAAKPAQAVQLSKQLTMGRRVPMLREVNKRECEVLRERWLSDECMQAVMDFMTRGKAE